jgi:WD40 repeat protein
VRHFARLLLCLAAQLAASAFPALAQSPEAPKKPANPVRLDRYGDPLPEGAKMRFGTTQWFVKSPRSVIRRQFATFTPDGRAVLIAQDHEIRKIDADTGKEVSVVKLQEHVDPMEWTEYAMSKDCKTLATVRLHLPNVRLWDTRSGKLIRELTVPGYAVEAIVWSGDGSTILVNQQCARPIGFLVHDAISGAETRLLNLDGIAIRPLWGTISAESRIVAAIISDQAVGLWNRQSGRMLHEIKVGAHSLDISPDGTVLACMEEHSKQVGLWSVASGKELPPALGFGDQNISSFGFSPDGTLMLFDGQTAQFWDVKRGRALRHFPFPEIDRWFFSPDGKKLAFSDDSTLRVWDALAGQEMHPPPGHVGHVEQFVVSPDGAKLFSKADGKGIVWDMAICVPLQSIEVPKTIFGMPSFSRDSKLIANANERDGIQVWDAGTGKRVREFSPSDSEKIDHCHAMNCHFSEDNRSIAAFMSTGTFIIWNVDQGKVLVQRAGIDGYWGCFSPDNKLLAVCADQSSAEDGRPYNLLIQETVSGRTLRRIPTKYVTGLAFSSDSKTVAGIRSKETKDERILTEICIWEVATGKERIHFDVDWGTPFVWSNDRRRIATVNRSSWSVWNAVSGEGVFSRSFSDLVFPVSSPMGFSKDGNVLLTGMEDRTILAWDLPSEKNAAKELSPTELERFWSDLNTPDGKKAHTAIWSLIDSPYKAIPFLNNHLHPASEKDIQTIERSFADLNNASFEVREKARNELIRLYVDAKPFLENTLEKNPSQVTRHRIESILSSSAKMPSESLAQLRAIEILEYVGSKEARRGLEIIAKGAPRSRLTQEAKESLERLNLAQKSD